MSCATESAMVVMSPQGDLASRPASRRSTGKAAGRALVCGVVFFAVIQVALAIVMEERRPELRDPEYGYKLAQLRQRLAEAPARPLLLTIGSSHVLNGFSPRLIAERYAGRDIPAVVFNFGLTATGPIRELLCVKRLLDQGIRPRWLVIEVLPGMLAVDNFWPEEESFHFTRLSADDLAFLHSRFQMPWQAYPEWAGERLVSCSSQRFCIMHCVAPRWCSPDTHLNGFLRGMDGDGWLPNAIPPVDAATYARGLARARIEYPEWLFARFQVTREADRAMGDLLALCVREQITPLLLLMPESATFRSWYTARAETCLHEYLDRLHQEYGAAVIDARSWVPDGGFIDGHHLVWSGALVFSAHFDRSVLRPLIEGRTPALD